MIATHTAVVTGGTRGIGLAIARSVLAAGGRAMITGRDVARLDAALMVLSDEAGAGRVAGFAADVRDGAAVESLMDETARRFGRLTLLVNNAGVGSFANVEAMADADWHRVIETNLTGAFLCSRAAVPRLRKAGGGWIVNIASLAGRNPFAGGGAYCASKAGLIAFSEALMQEVRADGIRVSVVLPGSVATGFGGRSRDGDDSWKLQPEDVAAAVMDLLKQPDRSLPSRVEIRPSRTQ